MKQFNCERLAQKLEQRAAQDLSEGNISGCAVWIQQNGQTIYNHCFGTRSPEGGAVVNQQTVFRLASMTKPITAAATMILVDRGLLSLDQPIAHFLPAFASLFYLGDGGERIPCSTPVTIRHLLTHSSGIGSGSVFLNMTQEITPSAMESVEAYVDFVAGYPLSFAPGTSRSIAPLLPSAC